MPVRAAVGEAISDWSAPSRKFRASVRFPGFMKCDYLTAFKSESEKGFDFFFAFDDRGPVFRMYYSAMTSAESGRSQNLTRSLSCFVICIVEIKCPFSIFEFVEVAFPRRVGGVATWCKRLPGKSKIHGHDPTFYREDGFRCTSLITRDLNIK